MRFPSSKLLLFFLLALTAISKALPADLLNVDVEVRHELSTRSDLEERGIGAVVNIAKMIFNVVKSIKAGLAQDKKNRGEFTYNLVQSLKKKDPKFNYVVCHTKHKTAFDGIRGKDWGHSHQEFDVKIGGTKGYEIYYFKTGKFTRQGDGGFLNWAYIGNVKSKSKDGKEIIFGPP